MNMSKLNYTFVSPLIFPPTETDDCYAQSQHASLFFLLVMLYGQWIGSWVKQRGQQQVYEEIVSVSSRLFVCADGVILFKYIFTSGKEPHPATWNLPNMNMV